MLQALQLNTFVLGGVAALHRLLGGVCVVGKSMLLRRATLEAIGGFALLARYLAEDQVCGEEVARRGGVPCPLLPDTRGTSRGLVSCATCRPARRAPQYGRGASTASARGVSGGATFT